MTSDGFGWESLLASNAPDGRSLRAALFTTYEPADERFLVEHLLPALLELGREPGGEGGERQLYLLELDARLKRLHDRLVVISSVSRAGMPSGNEADSGCYGWIWRSIRALTVGSRRKAVQHAKLWMLHWADANEGAEYLEIVVSSSNLTTDAFKGQLQAAWRACLQLEPRTSDTRLRSWGILPAFLRELAASAGDERVERVQPFLDLLARVECPQGVTLVASVPGTHSPADLRRTPWGVAGLGEILRSGRGRVAVSILTPYVGTWTVESLGRWCARLGGSPDQLRIAWIDRDHPWARERRWILPEPTLETFTEAQCEVLRLLPHASPESDVESFFHADHRKGDERWSHAKVYALRRGTVRRLLVTSANFSAAAWGRENAEGALTIENFELGVCTAGGDLAFDELEVFDDAGLVATTPREDVASASLLSWAQAEWDGSSVTVRCRAQDGAEVTGRVRVGGEWVELPSWTVDDGGRHRTVLLDWTDATRPPSVAELASKEERLTVPVFDARSQEGREASVPTEVDEELVEALRDQLLFEQYGGGVEPEPVPPDGGGVPDPAEGQSGQGEGEPGATIVDPDDGGDRSAADSYAVPAFTRARQHLRIVDNWAERLAQVSREGDLERAWLRRDGELLRDAFRRQEARDLGSGAVALGAKLAAEELDLRLQQLRGTDAAS